MASIDKAFVIFKHSIFLVLLRATRSHQETRLNIVLKTFATKQSKFTQSKLNIPKTVLLSNVIKRDCLVSPATMETIITTTTTATMIMFALCGNNREENMLGRQKRLLNESEIVIKTLKFLHILANEKCVECVLACVCAGALVCHLSCDLNVATQFAWQKTMRIVYFTMLHANVHVCCCWCFHFSTFGGMRSRDLVRATQQPLSPLTLSSDLNDMIHQNCLWRWRWCVAEPWVSCATCDEKLTSHGANVKASTKNISKSKLNNLVQLLDHYAFACVCRLAPTISHSLSLCEFAGI